MPWFFCDEQITSTEYTIVGDDARHIARSLRMKVGEELTLCSCYKTEYHCIITGFGVDTVEVEIISQKPCENEPSVRVALFQALTKGDKMDLIIQKAVELGACEMIPILTDRCVSRPDEKSAAKKITRWQKIAQQAAMQSRRAVIPEVKPLMNFNDALRYAKEFEKTLLFYEGGGESVKNLIDKNTESIAVFIGSEGGFAPSEVERLIENGGMPATLGKRILRAETAPLAALSVIMFQTGNFDE